MLLYLTVTGVLVGPAYMIKGWLYISTATCQLLPYYDRSSDGMTDLPKTQER